MTIRFEPGSDMRVTHLFTGAPTRGNYLGILLKNAEPGVGDARVVQVMQYSDAHGVGASLHEHPCHGMTLEDLRHYAFGQDAYAVVLRDGGNDEYYVAGETMKRRRKTALRLSE